MGFVLLCEPLLQLVDYHLRRGLLPDPTSKHWLFRVLRLLRLALVAALILGIVVRLLPRVTLLRPHTLTLVAQSQAATEISDAMTSADARSTLRTCR